MTTKINVLLTFSFNFCFSLNSIYFVCLHLFVKMDRFVNSKFSAC